MQTTLTKDRNHPPFPIMYPFFCDKCRSALRSGAPENQYMAKSKLEEILCKAECLNFLRNATHVLNAEKRRTTIPNRKRMLFLERLRDTYVSVAKIKAGFSTREKEQIFLREKWNIEPNVFLPEIPPNARHIQTTYEVDEFVWSGDYLPMASATPPPGFRVVTKIKAISQLGDIRYWFKLHGKFTWKLLKGQ